MSKPIVLSANEWTPESFKFMQPRVSSLGAKSISIISSQTNRSLHLSTPLMMTWGISDFVDEKGEGGGKYTMSLNFPGDDYRSCPTDEFLEKIKRFENIILDKAVEYSEVWWGETMSREVIKHMFFPLLKYSKNKDTKKIDMTKPPAIRVKVPCYDGTWNVEVYDTKMNMLFPSEDESITPPELVPKLSNVACVIQCTGIWIGGKGWGVSWKLVQAIVKPREMQSVFGKCHVMLSNEEIKTLDAGEDTQTVVQEEDVPQVKSAPPSKLKQTTIAPAAPVIDQTTVEDSDEETEAPPPPALSRRESYAPPPTTTSAQEPEPSVVTEDAVVDTTTATEPAPTPAKTVVKKIVKKKAT
jgi:hypothetical protein